jgi:O-antigen/teichoic acid export membrane protein
MATSYLESQSSPRDLAASPVYSERLTARATLNAIASLLDYFARIGVGVVITPLLVSGLGRSLFGVWEILGRLVGYMSATDGRPTDALRLIVSNQQTSSDSIAKQRLVGSAVGVWLIFLPLLTTLGAIVIWISPTIGKVSPNSYRSIRLTTALLVLNFLLANLVALPEAVLRGMNLGYKRMGLQAGLSLVGGLLTAGAIYSGTGIIGVAGAQVLLTGVTGVLFWFVVKKYVSWFAVRMPTRADIRRLMSLSVWNTIGNLVAKLQLASDVLILGIVASASTVSIYVLTGYAAQAVTGIITLIIGAITPGFAGLIGAKQFEKSAVLRNEVLAMNWLLVTTVGSTILLWNRSFLNLWVGESFYSGSRVNLLIILLMVQTSFIRSDAQFIDATLKLRDRIIVNLLAAVLSITLSVVLTSRLGIAGLCLGMLIGRLLQTVLYPLMINSYLGNSRPFSLNTIVRRSSMTAILFVAATYGSRRILAQNWIEWGLSVIATLSVATLLAATLGLCNECRKVLLQRLRLILRLA